MSEYTKEEAYDLFDKITDLMEEKPMIMIVEVISNILRNMCDGLKPNQKAAVVMTMLDALGIKEEDETMQ